MIISRRRFHNFPENLALTLRYNPQAMMSIAGLVEHEELATAPKIPQSYSSAWSFVRERFIAVMPSRVDFVALNALSAGCLPAGIGDELEESACSSGDALTLALSTSRIRPRV